MSNLIIHRGTEEIGGNAVEIKSKNARLLFDFGIPLESMTKENYELEDYKLPIKGLYRGEPKGFDAVFLTHAHPDHFGLLKLINPEIPIYVSKITYKILEKITPLLPNTNADNLNLKVIEDVVNFDDINVRAYNIDHSISGALAYEIQTEGKTVVYTGDIRFHGRAAWKSSVFKHAVKNPDYLIMEGTTLGRYEQEIIKEEDLEPEFTEIFKGKKLPLVQFSSQNIDRFVTVYRACKKAGKTLVIDPYTCLVLDVCSSLSKNIPRFDWENIMVSFANNRINKKLGQTKELFKYKSKKITMDEIEKHPEKFVIKGNGAINRQILKRFEKDNLIIIFSMWKGYLERTNQFSDYKDIISLLHSTGHAYTKDLKELVQNMKPKKLIPIHTECKEKYKELFNSDIIEMKDGEKLAL